MLGRKVRGVLLAARASGLSVLESDAIFVCMCTGSKLGKRNGQICRVKPQGRDRCSNYLGRGSMLLAVPSREIGRPLPSGVVGNRALSITCQNPQNHYVIIGRKS